MLMAEKGTPALERRANPRYKLKWWQFGTRIKVSINAIKQEPEVDVSNADKDAFDIDPGLE